MKILTRLFFLSLLISNLSWGMDHNPEGNWLTNNEDFSFTGKAWLQTKPIYAQIKQHRFIQELATGSLSEDVFKFYIEQDYLFLIDRAKAYSILISRTTDPDLVSYFTELMQNTKLGADGIFSKYNLNKPADDELRKSPACEAYTEYMLDMAANGSVQEGLIVLLPCTLIYQKIGEWLKSIPSRENTYQLWIDSYSSLERRKRVIKFIEVAEKLVSTSTYEEFRNLMDVYQRASSYEYDFWHDAYHEKL